MKRHVTTLLALAGLCVLTASGGGCRKREVPSAMVGCKQVFPFFGR